LFINKVDRGIHELKHSAEEMFQQFERVIDQANQIIATYECEEMGVSQVSPIDGTVAFGSGYYGWAFNLQLFARMYAEKNKMNYDVLVKKMWGENYFNPKTKKFQTHNDDGNGGYLQRAFNAFIMQPIISLCKNIMSGNWDKINKQTKSLNIELKAEEKEKENKDLMRCIMQKWICAADTLIEMIVKHLPSPRQAQAYRTAHLYQGPIDDECARAMQKCDKDGPLMIFISKMVPTSDNGRFYAFGRIFSGTVGPS